MTALRLTEAGHRVIVLEKGRRLSDEDLLKARRDPRAYLWQPSVGLRGFFWQRVFRHVGIIGGTGVGGGSTVWAGVLLEPRESFYRDRAWSHLSADWRAELAPYYERAAGMLGRVVTQHSGPMDRPPPGCCEEGRESGHVRAGPGRDPFRPRRRHRAGPVLRRRRSRAHGLPTVRRVPARVPVRGEEPADAQLPLPGGEVRCRDSRRARGQGHPAAAGRWVRARRRPPVATRVEAEHPSPSSGPGRRCSRDARPAVSVPGRAGHAAERLADARPTSPHQQ